jgi:large-conductance mechanosensitive channel
MNTREHADETASPPLPELTDERIDAIEQALFADISRDRTAQRARRGRWWIGGAAAAAVIIVAAVIAPSVGTMIGGAAVNDSGAAPAEGQPARDLGGGDSGSLTGTDESAGGGKSDGASLAPGAVDSSTGNRDIVTTASATVVVDDVPVAVKAIADAAEAHGGYVESMSIGQNGEAMPIDADTGVAYDSTYPYPYPQTGGWITVRVPSDQLTDAIAGLSSLGEVTASTIDRQDVTEQTVDLQARVDAAQASVDRLTELMSQATSTADLIAAEAALAERQANLESYQAQLKSLQGMVDMSSLTVTVQPLTEPVEADAHGFLDGLIAGWNGLVATLNGIVIALGFLIPWLVVLGLAGLIVWLVIRAVRRRRAARKSDATKTPDAAQQPDEPAEAQIRD